MNSITMKLAVVGIMLVGPLGVMSERTARQAFHVHVPPRLSIKAPPMEAHAVLLPGEAQVALAQQTWNVTSNATSGATVQFSTERCFHHVFDSRIRRDAQLDVKILDESRPGVWVVTQPNSVTHYDSGIEEASVQVVSSNSGTVSLGVTVTFLQGDSYSTPDGDYETTIVGTITAH